jgi:hypothetical protein
MLDFIHRHKDSITGCLSGLDRVLFRGTMRVLANAGGLMSFLWDRRVKLTEFADWSADATEQVVAASTRVAEEAGRPVVYVNNASARKEDLARQIAGRNGIKTGLICVLTAVEPCWSYELHRDRAQKKLVSQARQRKCLHHYHYHNHERFGLMHVRVQTWLPMGARVCLNGRSWLARRMDAAGIGYERKDNCFTWVRDVEAAQALMDEQLTTDWPATLGGLARGAVPGMGQLLAMDGRPMDHYWSADQTEWASDVMFQDPAALAAVYPTLVRQGMLTLRAPDVLRFLGRSPSGRFAGEVATSIKGRPEGVRLKHQAAANSVKMYDKQGSVLRIETTVNDPSMFKVYRGTEAEPDKKQWRSLRKGVADLHRRAEVSQACNERYLSHLAAVERPRTAGEVLLPLGQPTRDAKGRRHRGLRLLGEDAPLLGAVADGRHAVNGFRNADVRHALFGPDPAGAKQSRRRAGQVSRRLAMLRAHGLIQRVPKTRRWKLTEAGRQATTLLAATTAASAPALMKCAA